MKTTNRKIIIRMAIRKLGMAMPTMVNTRAPRSTQPSGLIAEMTPSGTDNSTDRVMASTANSKVLGMRSPSSLMTEALNQKEFPKSPWSIPPNHSTYWTTRF